MGRIATIPFDCAFVKTVVGRLVQLGDDISQVEVWVPGQRQGLALQQALQDAGCRHLPEIRPLRVTDALLEQFKIKKPKVITATARQQVLVQMILKKDPGLSYKQAWALAERLGEVLDEIRFYGVDLGRQWSGSGAAKGRHWDENWDFLQIVLEAYPAWLHAQEAVDVTQFEQMVLQQVAATYQPNEHKQVWAVGFADTTPAGFEVLKAIYESPNGQVVVQGLDVEAWRVGGEPRETSPQASMFGVLRQVGVQPETEIAVWDEVPVKQEKLAVVTSPQIVAEAETVAAYVVETLKNPNVTCAVVTPDRALARMVKHALALRGITVDDSAGVGLDETMDGELVLALGHLVARRMQVTAVADFMKHPKARFTLEDVAVFEQQVLRGLMPAPGLGGLREKVKLLDGVVQEDCSRVLDQLAVWVQPLTQLPGVFAVTDYMAALKLIFAQTEISADVVAVLTQVEEEAVGEVTQAQMVELLQVYLRNAVVRDAGVARCFIWGPLEARLQMVDTVILAGLNEGMWPTYDAPDAWLHPALRRAVGLSPAKNLIGLAAHDFAALCAGKDVVLSTREMVDGQVALPSRFLARLHVAQPDVWRAAVQRGEETRQQMVAVMRQGEATAYEPPAVKVPIALRPTRWSATAVDALVQNPYQSFLKRVLHLQPWDAFEMGMTPAIRGTVIHTWLELFGRGGEFTEMALVRLADEAVKHLPAPMQRVLVPRMVRLVPEIVTAWRQAAMQFEVAGKMEMDGVVFTARADRIDADGWVVDYKTTGSSVPDVKAVALGEKPQLGIELFLLQQGVFGMVPTTGVSVWQVAAGSQAGFLVKDYQLTDLEAVVPDVLREVEAGLRRFAAGIQGGEMVFFHNPMVADYDGVGLLARVAEWEGR